MWVCGRRLPRDGPGRQDVLVRSQGPHCLLENHRAEDVIGLGEYGELDTHQLDNLMVEQAAE